MSGECEICGEHAIDCICDSKKQYSSSEEARLNFALSALNLALLQLSILGYEIPKNFEFKKK